MSGEVPPWARRLERRLGAIVDTRAARVAGWCALLAWCLFVALELLEATG